MKNVLIALILLLTVSSCLPKKKSDPEPELAGTYQVSRLTSNGTTTNLPMNGVSAIVVVTRSGDTKIDFRIDLINTGKVFGTESASATIQKASGKEYDILDGSTRVGSINGTDFNLDYTDGGDRFVLIAHK